MKFANLKIGTRLGAAFAALLLLLLLVAALGWSSLTRTKMNIDVITNENNLKLDAANDLQRELNMCARSVRNYILFSDSDNRREMLGRLNQANDNMEEPFARLRRLVWSERGKALTGEIASRRAAWQAPAPRYERGYGYLFSKHVTQADQGCDFDFLQTDFGRTAGEPDIF